SPPATPVLYFGVVALALGVWALTQFKDGVRRAQDESRENGVKLKQVNTLFQGEMQKHIGAQNQALEATRAERAKLQQQLDDLAAKKLPPDPELTEQLKQLQAKEKTQQELLDRMNTALTQLQTDQAKISADLQANGGKIDEQKQVNGGDN